MTCLSGRNCRKYDKGQDSIYLSCHLDPDLDKAGISRHQDRQPIFGRLEPLKDMRKARSGNGRLSFGLFHDAIIGNGNVALNPQSSPKHSIWGWSQVDLTFSPTCITMRNTR